MLNRYFLSLINAQQSVFSIELTDSERIRNGMYGDLDYFINKIWRPFIDRRMCAAIFLR